MSSTDGENDDSGPGTREIAHRLFATEFDASSLESADSDEERAPKYVITPTGARVNRLFAVGVLTEVQRVNDEVVRARVVDPTGAFVVYAGQYQPDALAFLERADPPMFVAVTGKANTFQPEDSNRVYTSVRPESIAEVDAETRDRWTVQAADHTLRRVGEFARALEEGDGGEPGTGIALAREEYGTTPAYLSALRETALGAAQLVAGEIEEVAAPEIAPGEDDSRRADLAELQSNLDDTDHEESDSTAVREPEPTGESTEPVESSESAEPTTEESTDGLSASTESETTTADADEAATDEPSDADAVTTSAEDETEPETDDLGDFDPGEGSGSGPTTDAESSEAESGSADGAEPVGDDERYEFDEEERAEIEAEFDMEFSSGNDVEEAGNADIDAPEPDGIDTADVEETGAEPEPDDGFKEDSEPEPSDAGVEEELGNESEEVESDDEEEGSVNVEDRAMDAMRELADGDGADRNAVVERVSEEYGVDSEAVEDAIESALLSGRCYEPQEGVLKSI
jgi:RPA family protein